MSENETLEDIENETLEDIESSARPAAEAAAEADAAELVAALEQEMPPESPNRPRPIKRVAAPEAGEVQDPTAVPGREPLGVDAYIAADRLIKETLYAYGETVGVLERALVRGERPTKLQITFAKQAMKGARDAAAKLLATELRDLLMEAIAAEGDETA